MDPRIRPCVLSANPSFASMAVCRSGRPAAILRDAALELVHRFDGAVLDQVIDVAAQQCVRVERILDGGQQRQILFVEQIAAAE